MDAYDISKGQWRLRQNLAKARLYRVKTHAHLPLLTLEPRLGDTLFERPLVR